LPIGATRAGLENIDVSHVKENQLD